MATTVEMLPQLAAPSRTMAQSIVRSLPETKVLVPARATGPRRAIYSVNVADYAPEITALTYPFIKSYAHKIGASFELITDRMFDAPWPITCEKFQSGMLARENKNEWTYCIDSDTLIHPDCFDFTQHVEKDTVMHNGKDINTVRWRMDKYFKRDGRYIGSCTWNTAASDWCLDIWQPLDMTYEEALDRINITVGERNCGVNPKEHLIDDYTHSRNIARYGLKFKTYTEVCQGFGMPGNPYLFHLYTHTSETKFARMCATLVAWGCMTPQDANDAGKHWGIIWDACQGMDGRGTHNTQQQCPHCGNTGVANARRVPKK